MRNALVLTDESARHPFRASLPPHICRGIKPHPARPGRAFAKDDVRAFFSAYIACLLAVLIFIA